MGGKRQGITLRDDTERSAWVLGEFSAVGWFQQLHADAQQSLRRNHSISSVVEPALADATRTYLEVELKDERRPDQRELEAFAAGLYETVRMIVLTGASHGFGGARHEILEDNRPAWKKPKWWR